MLAQVAVPDRNYPALFLALDDVLEARGDGRPDDDALRRSFGELDRAWIEVYGRSWKPPRLGGSGRWHWRWES